MKSRMLSPSESSARTFSATGVVPYSRNTSERGTPDTRECRACGSDRCACTGQPSTSRNQFVSEEHNERIRWYLSRFDYGKEVKRLDEVIQVDDMVRGCPMKVPSSLQTLEKYLGLSDIVQHA